MLQKLLVSFLTLSLVGACVAPLKSARVKDEQVVTLNIKKSSEEVVVFPARVYLEKTSRANLLNFELGFKVKEDGKLFVIIYYYLDQNNNVLLLRRLVKHHIDNVARFIGVFDPNNHLRTYDNNLKKGDFVFITHPFSEMPSELKITKVQAMAYMQNNDGSFEEMNWEVPILDYNPQQAIYPPFKGKWLHLEGHDIFSHHRQIYYHRNSNYFAIDFLKIDEKGELNKNDGTENTDYYAYNEPVYAPADGEIIELINNFSDNPVGGRAADFDPNHPGGNIIMIKHHEQLYSYLAHLKKDSMRVKKGDKVKAGDLLALCGNSGNSDAPHIHFHMVPQPLRETLQIHGVPIVFRKYHSQLGKKLLLEENTGSYPGEIIVN